MMETFNIFVVLFSTKSFQESILAMFFKVLCTLYFVRVAFSLKVIQVHTNNKSGWERIFYFKTKQQSIIRSLRFTTQNFHLKELN